MSYAYAVIGTGAVGGYYGALLAQAGFDVSFLVRSDLEHVRRHGLRVYSPDGDLVLPRVDAFGDAAELPRADVVIIAVKATANAQLRAILPHVVRPGVIVVLMQNGMGGEDPIAAAAARAPGRWLVDGVRDEIGPGTIRHQWDRQVTLAPWTPDGKPEATDGLAQLAAELAHAGIPVRLLDNLALARWRKLLWNIPFSGLSVALDRDTRGIVEDATRWPRRAR